ncbi:hypothetical protein GCQ56_01535 [Marinifilum sp. N1E240]|uniref:DUF5683 domain-containing protein n=1 Tax=Marinifilum sp. N1E240 TaxID=2608082 RepID=UPI00128C88B7|nr:DUF5683 domain-containing protein [Marinifilum sp. N1E240]MPQ45676.1 hypothetical protein [Marinifilum sp. N1E240]
MNNLRPLLITGVVFLAMLFTSILKVEAQQFTADTVQVVESNVKIHSPHKATMYSVILPGLGQAYNKKYWKIPILYAGIGATIYAINWNTKNFKRYKNGFKDFSNYYDFKYQDPDLETPIDEPSTKRYEDLYTDGFDFENSSSSFDSWFKTQLKNKKDSYKQDRDLSYIILAGVYVLNIIDAAIDAHFTNFNVNDNLTIRVEPAVSYSALSGNSLGFRCQITF